ncbi:MAG: ribosome silencing factor [candidate division WOR-3 bacterium]
MKITRNYFLMLKNDSDKSSYNLAKALARIISEKKGEDIIIFDLKDISPITDYFVIATGLSDIHNKTIAEHLSEFEEPNHIEGLEGGGWILLDYIDVIVHIFSKEAREFYGLERLWGDAPQIKI